MKTLFSSKSIITLVAQLTSSSKKEYKTLVGNLLIPSKFWRIILDTFCAFFTLTSPTFVSPNDHPKIKWV
ncbi:hypothetical protein N9R23_04065, partial [Saprospiraceae bacterium]|nr:hypothetical protein [Saprospiraceae bacterium]